MCNILVCIYIYIYMYISPYLYPYVYMNVCKMLSQLVALRLGVRGTSNNEDTAPSLADH